MSEDHLEQMKRRAALADWNVHQIIKEIATKNMPKKEWCMMLITRHAAKKIGIPEGTYAWDKETEFWSRHH